jgi:putative polyhydroxyalkanoate system protein
MSTISIRRPHSLTPQKAQGVANSMAAELEREYGVRSTWKGNTLHFERSGVNGTLRLAPRELLLDVKLGLMLFALRDSIAAQIERKLDQLLPAKPAQTGKTAKTAKRRS